MLLVMDLGIPKTWVVMEGKLNLGLSSYSYIFEDLSKSLSSFCMLNDNYQMNNDDLGKLAKSEE